MSELLSWRTPPPGWLPPPHVMDGWGARPLRWLSVLVGFLLEFHCKIHTDFWPKEKFTWKTLAQMFSFFCCVHLRVTLILRNLSAGGFLLLKRNARNWLKEILAMHLLFVALIWNALRWVASAAPPPQNSYLQKPCHFPSSQQEWKVRKVKSLIQTSRGEGSSLVCLSRGKFCMNFGGRFVQNFTPHARIPNSIKFVLRGFHSLVCGEGPFGSHEINSREGQLNFSPQEKFCEIGNVCDPF